MGNNAGSQDSIWLLFDQQATEPSISVYLFSLPLCCPHKQPAVSIDVSFYVWLSLTVCHSGLCEANCLISMSGVNCTDPKVKLTKTTRVQW